MAELPKTRNSLLIRLQNRSNESAWQEFVEIYEKAIHSYARSRGLQDADAWDVTQKVLAAVEKKVASWNHDGDRGTFRGWLFRVARNIAVDTVGAQSRRAVVSGDSRVEKVLAAHAQQNAEESTLFWKNYRRKLFHWAADKVKEDFQETSWQAFWLTAIDGKQADEVASQLQITAGSVYAAKFRIVKRIRLLIEKLDDQDFDDGSIEQMVNGE